MVAVEMGNLTEMPGLMALRILAVVAVVAARMTAAALAVQV
tara:strand:+ start:378 stop:500 length:123 start_codon:yes stop_codon:yes gene_type:complete